MGIEGGKTQTNAVNYMYTVYIPFLRVFVVPQAVIFAAKPKIKIDLYEGLSGKYKMDK